VNPASEDDQTTASRVTYVVARLVVGTLGVLICAMAAGALFAVVQVWPQWGWTVVVSFPFLLLGVWLIWSAVKSDRKDVMHSFTLILVDILDAIF